MDSVRYPVPIASLTFDPDSGYYGFTVRLPSRVVHWGMTVFESIDSAKVWVDPWGDRIWEEPGDADETALLISRQSKPVSLASCNAGVHPGDE